MAAARAARVDHFVRTMPDGYDTCSTTGLEPVGRREAVAHHRAGVPGQPADPDPGRGDQFGRHPHRGADPAGDGGTAGGPTSFVIAHRLSTIRDADIILVMDAGRIVGAGHARRAHGRAGLLLRPVPVAVPSYDEAADVRPWPNRAGLPRGGGKTVAIDLPRGFVALV